MGPRHRLGLSSLRSPTAPGSGALLARRPRPRVAARVPSQGRRQSPVPGSSGPRQRIVDRFFVDHVPSLNRELQLANRAVANSAADRLRQAMIRRITRPPTSVRRKSRPL
jgi:hypothetical protein